MFYNICGPTSAYTGPAPDWAQRGELCRGGEVILGRLYCGPAARGHIPSVDDKTSVSPRQGKQRGPLPAPRGGKRPALLTRVDRAKPVDMYLKADRRQAIARLPPAFGAQDLDAEQAELDFVGGAGELRV